MRLLRHPDDRIDAAHRLDISLRRSRARQRVKMGGHGIIPAEIALVDGPGIMLERAVIALDREHFCQTLRQGNCFGNLVRPQALRGEA